MGIMRATQQRAVIVRQLHRWRASISIALGGAAIMLAACSPIGYWSPSLAAPSPTIDPLIEVAEVRRALGLETDRGLLQSLHRDSAAIARARRAGYDFPLTEAEVLLLDARARDTGEVGLVVRRYGADHPEAWAGSYVDARLGVVVARFTGDLGPHEAALAGTVHRDARLRIEPAGWTLADLEAVAAAASVDQAWFESVGATLTGTGVDIIGNVVLLDVQSDRAGIVELVLARFGGPIKVRVRLAATPWNGDHGVLVVRVRDALGAPVGGLDCDLLPDDMRGVG